MLKALYYKRMLFNFLRNLIAPPRRHPVKPLESRSDPAEAARRSFEFGRRALMQGDPGAAKVHLEEALAQLPTHGDAWFHLSAAQHALGNLLDAGICCARALEIDPQPQNWRDSLKNMTTDLGAESEFEAWTALADSHWIACLALGNTLRRQGRLTEAEVAYRRALNQSGGSPFAARRLACLLAITGRGDEADDHFLKCAGIGLSPDRVVRLSKRFFDDLVASGPAMRARLPRTYGSLAAASEGLVFLLSCDPLYFRKFAYAAANSIRKNCQMEFTLHFHIVDPNETIAAEIETLREKLGLREVGFTHETAPEGDAWAKRTWYACARFLRMPALLSAYGKPVWLLDLDQLVVGDVLRCVTTPKGESPCDIAMVRWHPTRWDPWEYFSASAVYAAPTAGAITFLEHVANYTAHHLLAGLPLWFLDQIALFAAHAQTAHATTLRHLPPSTVFLSNPEVPVEAPADAVFWTVVNSLDKNAASINHPTFLKYASPSTFPHSGAST